MSRSKIYLTSSANEVKEIINMQSAKDNIEEIYYHPRLARPKNCKTVMASWMKKTRKKIIKLDALSSLD